MWRASLFHDGQSAANPINPGILEPGLVQFVQTPSLPPLTSPIVIRGSHALRRIEHAWRHGELAVRSAWIATLVLLSILAVSLWQAHRLQTTLVRLQSQGSRLQSLLAARSTATSRVESTDFTYTLAQAPSAAQIMQTLQQAAAKEGAVVASLQADDHPPTVSTLGHLDLAISIKASYPSILVVLQQTLDRYPGATVRQFGFAHIAAPTGMAPMVAAPQPGATALQPVSEADAHVLLSFWRRPLGAGSRTIATTATTGSAAADGPASASADAMSVGADTVIAGRPSAAAPVAAQATSGGR